MVADDLDAIWAARLAATCPACGVRAAESGVCEVCGTDKQEYRRREPWKVAIKTSGLGETSAGQQRPQNPLAGGVPEEPALFKTSGGVGTLPEETGRPQVRRQHGH